MLELLPGTLPPQYTLPSDPRVRVIVLRRALSYKRAHFKLAAYRPTEKQLFAHSLSASKRVVGVFGGNRTGKSILSACEIAYHLTGLYPDWWEGRTFDHPTKVWVASESQEDTRDGAQALLLGDLSAKEIGTGTIPAALIGRKIMKRGISDCVDSIRVRHVTGGWSDLGFKAYNQGRESFQSVSRDVVWLDEEPPEDVYNECRMRVLSRGGYLLLAFTPLKGMSEVCMKFLGEKVASSYGMVNITWSDNPYLPKWAITELEESMLPHERVARQFGRPVQGRGLIYPIDENLIICDPFSKPLPDFWPQGMTVDFGWTDPTASLAGALDPMTDTLYVWWNYKVSDTPFIVHAQAIREVAERGRLPIEGDPGGMQSNQADGKKLIEEYNKELQSANLRITLAENEVHAGLVRVYRRMITGKLKIVNTCASLLHELRHYHYDKTGKVADKQDDHLCDCLRYLCAMVARMRPPMQRQTTYSSSEPITGDRHGAW